MGQTLEGRVSKKYPPTHTQLPRGASATLTFKKNSEWGKHNVEKSQTLVVKGKPLLSIQILLAYLWGWGAHYHFSLHWNVFFFIVFTFYIIILIFCPPLLPPSGLEPDSTFPDLLTVDSLTATECPEPGVPFPVTALPF